MRKLNAIVSTEAVLAMGLMVYSAVQGAVPLFGGITIHWPLWMLVAGVGVGALVGFNWPWMRRLRSANRFHDLTNDIAAAHHAFSEDMHPLIGDGRISGPTRAKILTIFQKLEPFSVPCPPLNEDMLGIWFPVVQAMAATGNLAAARAITLPPSLPGQKAR